MASSLKFDGLTDYTTNDPVRLRVELQRQNAKVAEGFTRAQAQFEPIPVERQLNPNEEVNGLFGEAYLCDTTGASVPSVPAGSVPCAGGVCAPLAASCRATGAEAEGGRC